MKKLSYLLFLLFLLVPIFVNAETCELDKVEIKAITIKDQSPNVEEIQPVQLNNNDIHLNLKFKEIGDYITYNIFIQNNSTEDFRFSTDKWNMNSDYIEYQLQVIDPIVKANQGKAIELKVIYTKKVPQAQLQNGQFPDNKVMHVNLLSKSDITNPKTGPSHTIFSILCIISGIVIIRRSLKDTKVQTSAAILVALAVIPLSVYAACQLNLQISSEVIIEPEGNKICIITGTGQTSSRLEGPDISKRTITYSEFQNYLNNLNITSSTLDFMNKADVESKTETPTNPLTYSVDRNQILYEDTGCYIFSSFG